MAGSTDFTVALSGVAADAVLLVLSLHDALPILVAVLVMVPAVAGAVALIVIVALAPEASEPTAQVTVHEGRVQPGMAETKVTPAGWVSGTVEPVLASGPLFVAVRV